MTTIFSVTKNGESLDRSLYSWDEKTKTFSTKEDGLVLSKKEGGEWALTHLPSEYHPLIADAMHEYSGSADVAYDQALAKRYAEYAISRLRQ